jgi:hypothetical protein
MKDKLMSSHKSYDQDSDEDSSDNSSRENTPDDTRISLPGIKHKSFKIVDIDFIDSEPNTPRVINDVDDIKPENNEESHHTYKNAKSVAKETEENNFSAISRYINTSVNNDDIYWTNADEEIIKSFVHKARIYKTLYNQSYFRYSFLYKILLWPLVLTTCFSIGLQMIFATLITTNAIDANNGIFSIITTVVSIIVTILTYLQAKTSFYDKAKGCRLAGASFSEYADQLETLLLIDRRRRTNPLESIAIAQSDYKRIRKIYSEYEIPSNIYKDYLRRNKKESYVDFSDMYHLQRDFRTQSCLDSILECLCCRSH